MMPDQLPEPTVFGAFGSVVAVPVTSRAGQLFTCGREKSNNESPKSPEKIPEFLRQIRKAAKRLPRIRFMRLWVWNILVKLELSQRWG